MIKLKYTKSATNEHFYLRLRLEKILRNNTLRFAWLIRKLKKRKNKKQKMLIIQVFIEVLEELNFGITIIVTRVSLILKALPDILRGKISE